MRIKKTHKVIVTFVVVFALMTSCLSGTLGFARNLDGYHLQTDHGTVEPGSARNPYLILSEEDFLQINTANYNTADTYFLQENDFEINVTSSAAIPNFKGTYDGGGHTISVNFAVDATLGETVKGFALFGNIDSDGADKAGIKNLTISTRGEIKLSANGRTVPQGDFYLGGLVARLENGFIKQCKITGSLAVDFSTIYNADSESHGSGRLLVGAVAGSASEGAEITDVITGSRMTITTNISNPSSWSMVVGGIVGELKSATIRNAVVAENAVVDLSPASYSDFIGGIAGIVDGAESSTTVEENVVLGKVNTADDRGAYTGTIAGGVFAKPAEIGHVIGKHYSRNILAGEAALHLIDGAYEEQISAKTVIVRLEERMPDFLHKRPVAEDYSFGSNHCDLVEKADYWPEWDMLIAPNFNRILSELSNKGSLPLGDAEYPNYVAFTVDEPADIQGLNYRIGYTSLAKYPINMAVLGYSVDQPENNLFMLQLGIQANTSEIDFEQAQVWYNPTPDDQSGWRAARNTPMMLGFSGEERALDVQIRSRDHSLASSEVGRLAIDKNLTVRFSGEDQGTTAARTLEVFSGGALGNGTKVEDDCVYVGIEDYIYQHHDITVEAFFKVGGKTSDVEQFVIAGSTAPSMVQLMPANGRVGSTEKIAAAGLDPLSKETVYYTIAVGDSKVSAPKFGFTSSNMLSKDLLNEFPLGGILVEGLLTGDDQRYLQIRTITGKEDPFNREGELYSVEQVFDFQLVRSTTEEAVHADDSLSEVKKIPYDPPVLSSANEKTNEKDVVIIVSPQQLPTVLRPDFYNKPGDERQYTFEEISEDPNGAYGVIQVTRGEQDPLLHKTAVPGILLFISDLDSGEATDERLLEGTFSEVRYYQENTLGNLVENTASRFNHEIVSLESDGGNSELAVLVASLVPSGADQKIFTRSADGIMLLGSGAPASASSGYILDPTPREPVDPFDFGWEGIILTEKDRELTVTSTEPFYYVYREKELQSNYLADVISQITDDNITSSFIKKYVPSTPTSPTVISQSPDEPTGINPDFPELNGILYIFRDQGDITEKYAVSILETVAVIPQASGQLAAEGILEMDGSVLLFTSKSPADASIFYTVSNSSQIVVKPEVVKNSLVSSGIDTFLPKDANTKKYTGSLLVSSVSTGVPGSEIIISYLITENKETGGIDAIGNVYTNSYILKNKVGNITASLPTGTTANAGETFTLTTPTNGAEIYYTTSRSNISPTRPWKDTSGLTSKKYTGPIVIETPEEGTTTFQVNAIAFKDNETESDMETFSYTVSSAVQHTITADPAGGSLVAKGTVVKLATSYLGADGEIHYTTINDLTNEPPMPEMFDTKYTTGIVINENTVVCAALFIGGQRTEVEYFSYSVGKDIVPSSRVQKPRASIADNTAVANNTKVTFSTATNGADVYYTTDGTTPEEGAGTTVKGKNTLIKAASGETVVLKLYATKDGMNDSETATYYYEVNKIAGAKITASPGDGEKAIIGSTIELQCNVSGAHLYYTVDGSDPDTSSKKGKSIVITGKKGETLEINAVAELDGYYSAVQTFTYAVVEEAVEKLAEEPVVTVPLIDPPGANIAPGTMVEKGTAVKLIAKAGIIYYTLDGSNPTEKSLIYATPIIIDGSIIIKAVAVEGGLVSKAATFQYGVVGQVEAPVTNHPGGEIVRGTEVSLSTSTPGARIYYSTDGAQPSPEDIRNLFEYTAPFPLNNSVVIKTLALKEGMTPSPVNSIEYTVVPKKATSTDSASERELKDEGKVTPSRLSTYDEYLELVGPKYEDVVLRDPETQVVVSANKGVLPANARIVIVREENPSSRDREAVNNALDLDLESLYSVKIVLEDGTEIQPTSGEMAEIGVRIPKGYENAALVLCIINENGEVESFDTRRSGDMAYAEIEYFSHKFAIAISGINESGDNNHRDLVIRTAIVLTSAGIVGYLGHEVIQLRKKRLENES